MNLIGVYILSNLVFPKDKQRIFKKQKTRRNSDVFVESQCGFHIAIVFAEKLRQDGVKGFDNELLKNLYLDHAYKLLASIIVSFNIKSFYN